MTERLCRIVVAACATVAIVAGGLAIGDSAGAATPSHPSVTVASTAATDAVAVPGAVSTTASAATPTVHRIWVSVDSVTTSSTDDTVTVPTDRASAAAFVSSLNTYWNRETGGAVSLVLGGFEVRPLSSAGCTVNSLFAVARTLDFAGRFATTADWSGTNDHLLALSTEPCTQSSVGEGSVGGAGGVMATAVGSAGPYGLAVAAHEFGHNLGLLHANVDTCPAGTDSGSTCATTPYTDFLDAMGGAVAGSLPHVSTPQLISLGYLHDYASLSQASGIVQQQLMPVGAGSGTRSVQITDPTTGEKYYVEYRIADATDAASPEFGPNLSCTTASNGLTRCWGGMSTTLGGIRVLRVGADGTSVLSVGTYGSTHLDVGQSFENHDGAFRVTVTSLSPTAGAVLTVAFGPSISTTPDAADAASAAVPAPAATFVPLPAIAAPAVVFSTSHVAARLRHATIRKGTKPVVVAVVTGDTRPTGKIIVWANGHRMRTVTLRASDKGVRAITLPRRTSTGSLAIRVTYSGSSRLTGAASVVKRLKVR